MSRRFNTLRTAADRYSLGDMSAVGIAMLAGVIAAVFAAWVALMILASPASAVGQPTLVGESHDH